MSATRFHSGHFASRSTLGFAGDMRYDKFIRKEARRAGITVEHLLEFHEVLPCDYGKKKCKGWALAWKFGARRRREATA